MPSEYDITEELEEAWETDLPSMTGSGYLWANLSPNSQKRILALLERTMEKVIGPDEDTHEIIQTDPKKNTGGYSAFKFEKKGIDDINCRNDLRAEQRGRLKKILKEGE